MTRRFNPADRTVDNDPRIAALEQDLAQRTAERDAARRALERKALDAGDVPNAEGHEIGARLFAVVSELQRLSEELEQRNAALAQSNWDLEQRVAQRTAALEAALDAKRRSEARFRAVADGVPQLVWTSHPEGRWDFSNKRWQAYTGQREEETKGWGWLESVHPDDHERTMEAWHDATKRHGRLFIEHRIRGRDGEYRWFETQALPTGATFTDPEAEWVGSTSDIHARKLAEAALLESKQRLEQELKAQRQAAAEGAELFRAMLAVSLEALFVVVAGADGRLVHNAVNPPFERLTGLWADQVQGREARQFLPEDAAAALEAGYRACAGAGSPYSFDAALDLPAGRRTLRITLVPARAAERAGGGAGAGSPLHLLGTARDIGNEMPTSF